MVAAISFSRASKSLSACTFLATSFASSIENSCFGFSSAKTSCRTSDRKWFNSKPAATSAASSLLSVKAIIGATRSAEPRLDVARSAMTWVVTFRPVRSPRIGLLTRLPEKNAFKMRLWLFDDWQAGQRLASPGTIDVLWHLEQRTRGSFAGLRLG